jgi:Family of unknown function (DUF6256)
MILRGIVIPLVAAYALWVVMALSTLRTPVTERTQVEPREGWHGALRYLAVTIGGGYLFFLLVVLVFHVVIAGQHGAIADAARGGGFLAFIVAAPVFLLSMWWSSRG